MWSLAGCVFLATSALAAGYAPYTGIQAFRNPKNYAASGAVYPIDFSDELNIQNPMLKPGQNIMYSFEQIRRDQPPQVEMREEDIGRYMYRKPSGTTTTRAPEIKLVVPDISAEVTDLSQSHQYNQNNQYQEVDSWRQMPAAPARTTTTQDPFSSDFDDFSFIIRNSDKIKPEARYPPMNTWSTRTTTLPTPTPIPQWEEFSQGYRHQPSTQRHHTPEWSNYESQSTAVFEPELVETLPNKVVEEVPQPQLHWTEIQARQSRHQVGQRMQAPPSRNVSNRGHHKFNWGELESPMSTTEAIPVRVPTTMAPGSQRKSPPPPVPTLTSWSGDDF